MGFFSVFKKNKRTLQLTSQNIHKEMTEIKKDMHILLLDLEELEKLRRNFSTTQLNKKLLENIENIMKQLLSYDKKVRKILHHIIPELSKETKIAKVNNQGNKLLNKIKTELLTERNDLLQYQLRLKTFDHDIEYAKKKYILIKSSLTRYISDHQYKKLAHGVYDDFIAFETSLAPAKRLLLYLHNLFNKILQEEGQVEEDIKKAG